MVACTGSPEPIDSSELVLTGVFYPPVFVNEGYYVFPVRINFHDLDGAYANLWLNDDYFLSVNGIGDQPDIELTNQGYYDGGEELLHHNSIELLSCYHLPDCAIDSPVDGMSFSLSLNDPDWPSSTSVNAISDAGLGLSVSQFSSAADPYIEIQWSNFGVADIVEFWSEAECGETASSSLNVVSSSEDLGRHLIQQSKLIPTSNIPAQDCNVTLVAYRIVAGDVNPNYHDAVFSYVSTYDSVQFTILAD